MLTFQWKPLSPRFSPDISRILTLRMHERRISQRNTDAANPTPRPRLAPAAAPGATTMAWNALRTARLARQSRLSLACWRPPPPSLHTCTVFVFTLVFLARARPPTYLPQPYYLPMCWHERQARSRSQCSHVGCVVQLQTYL